MVKLLDKYCTNKKDRKDISNYKLDDGFYDRDRTRVANISSSINHLTSAQLNKLKYQTIFESVYGVLNNEIFSHCFCVLPLFCVKPYCCSYCRLRDSDLQKNDTQACWE